MFTPPSSANGKWTKQFAAYDECKSNSCVGTNVVRGLAAAVKGDKIYLFLANISTQAQNTGSCDGLNLCFWFVEGDATNTNKEGNLILWKEENLKVTGVNTFNDILKKELSDINLLDSSVFVIKEEKIVFIVKSHFKDKTSQADKKVAAVFLLDETGGKELKWVHHENSNDCCSTFFQFEDKIFKISTDNSKDSSKNQVMVLDALKEQNFKEIISGSIFCVRDFLKDKENFVSVTIKQKGTVLLFTQQKNVVDSNNGGKKNVYLWMTDGARVSCAGTIVENLSSTDTFYASLLYTDKKLFALHQTSETTDNKIELTLLKDQLQNITNTLDAWTKSNNEIQHLYEDTDTATNINFTNGIVGFLSGDGQSTNDWKDGYFYVNAEIPKPNGEHAVKVPDGFKFNGAGAGAKWPVGEQEDPRYNFKDPGFTLVATVTVGSSINGEDNSILGVVFAKNTNTNKVGLWCTTSGNKWAVKVGNDQKTKHLSEINCTRNEKHYMAVILNKNDNKLFVYVNGEQIPKSDSEGITIEPLQNIEYFYFGVEKKTQNAKTDVTITNVLLYNQPFEKNKIIKLKHKKEKKEKKLEPEQKRESDSSDLSTPDESKIQTDSFSQGTSDALTDEKDNKQSSSPLPPTTEDSAVRVGVVGVMCFMLFGVFTLLGRYVY